MRVPLPPDDSSGRGGPSTRIPRHALVATTITLSVALAALVLFLLVSGQSTQAGAQQPTAQALVPPTAEPSETPPPARLSVESEPAGAAVFVDGVRRGLSPLSIENLDPGPHRVRLSLAAHEEWQSEVVLSAGQTSRLEVFLPATPSPTPAPFPTPSGPLYPIAVMVENSVDARPQSGLARADIVYEALTEGWITRFMAIYVNGESDVIGPVRSARHYFVYLACEYDAPYVHIGASPQGYDALRATGLPNLDETHGDPGFWRVRTRYAPHNAYTSTSLIRSSLERVWKAKPGSLAGFAFREESGPVRGEAAGEISLAFPAGYSVKYVYSPEDRSYHRYMDGVPHEDAETSEQVAPRNVVVQFVRSWVIDDVGRLDMAQVGQGKALYFRDGVVTEGYWSKSSPTAPTRWYDSQDEPVQMNPGKIWVQIIPPSVKLSY